MLQIIENDATDLRIGSTYANYQLYKHSQICFQMQREQLRLICDDHTSGSNGDVEDSLVFRKVYLFNLCSKNLLEDLRLSLQEMFFTDMLLIHYTGP